MYEELISYVKPEGSEVDNFTIDAGIPSTSEQPSVLAVNSEQGQGQDESDTDNDENNIIKRTKEEEQDLTNKFLTGQLTFTEYAAQYGDSNYDENIDEADADCQSEDVKSTISDTDFEKNLAQVKGSTTNLRKLRAKVVRNRNNLPPALKGLMGEANLRYAKGENENAIKMCFEVIRQFPWAPEPFETLSSLYEEKGDSEKSLQVSLLAAHLNPRASKHVWISLAERSEERGEMKQAVTCYCKAVHADNKDFDLYVKLAAMYERIGDTNSALKTYLRLLRSVQPHNEETLVDVSKMVAKRYHAANKLDKAKEALKTVFDKYPQFVNTELVNIMLELLIGLHEYKSCIDILKQFCNVEIIINETDGETELLSCSTPDNLVIDIYAKFVIVLTHLKAFQFLDNYLVKIKNMDPDEAGDVFFDVAEALILEKKYDEAIGLLIPLTVSDGFNLPAIWLRLAECFKAVNRIEESVKAYLEVVEKAPNHLGARLALSALLNSLGRREQALEVLTQDEDSEVLNTALLYERSLLLLKMPEQKEQFVAVAQLFLSRHLVHIKNKEDLNALTTNKSDRKKVVIKENQNLQIAFSQGDELKGEFSQIVHEPSLEEEWVLFKSLCEICLELKQMSTLQRVTFSALGSHKFANSYAQEIDLLCLSACYYNGDAYYGYNIVRNLVLKNINCERSWNLFNMMIMRADDSRHNRFLMRMSIKHPHHKALTNLHANNCLVAGTYKYALSDYTTVFQKENSALMAFLIAITLCQMACQKFSAKKHSLVTQAVAYFYKYKELRGPEGLQESHYNIGRALHQLGLLPPAIHHYKKALEFNSKFIDSSAKHLCLQKEAAFNLHLIYLASGARDIARMYIEKYIVV